MRVVKKTLFYGILFGILEKDMRDENIYVVKKLI